MSKMPPQEREALRVRFVGCALDSSIVCKLRMRSRERHAIPDSKTEAGRHQLEVPDALVPHLVWLTGRRLPAAPLFAHAATHKRAQNWAREQVTRVCKLAGVPRVTPPRATWDRGDARARSRGDVAARGGDARARLTGDPRTRASRPN